MCSIVGGPRGHLCAAGVVGPRATYVRQGWCAQGPFMLGRGGGPKGHLC
jgi:hypothetical protein